MLTGPTYTEFICELWTQAENFDLAINSNDNNDFTHSSTLFIT